MVRIRLRVSALCGMSLLAALSYSSVWGSYEQKNSVLMDDGFEYSLVDYGVGALAPEEGAAGGEAFWMEFGVRNTSEQEAKTPRYLTEFEILESRGGSCPARPYYSAAKFVPPRKQKPYAPGEMSMDVRQVPIACVKGSVECHVYLDKQHFFRILQPADRRRDYRRDNRKVGLDGLQVGTGIDQGSVSDQAVGGPVYLADSPGIKRPVAITQPRALYTTEARKRKKAGDVLLELIVRATGSVDTFRVIHGLGYGLDESAIEAVAHKWRFRPGLLDRKPVDVRVNVEVPFDPN